MPSAPSAALALTDCLAQLPDPRVTRTRLHPLTDILVTAVCAVVCGAQGWDDIVLFAHAKEDWLKEDWLKERLPLPNGIPCADTFRRVFARLDPDAFAEVFAIWVQALRARVEQKKEQKRKKAGAKAALSSSVIAIDGKTLRHSFDTASEQSPLHLVSAFAQETRLVLAQVKVDDKSNEITAVPPLLALLDLAGCIVTADAMSCQKDIARQIVEQGGHYVLALKQNQPTLYDDTRRLFEHALEHRFADLPHGTFCHVEKGHGRIVTRRCIQVDLVDLDGLWQEPQQEWAGLASLAMLQCERQMLSTGRTSVETRYYISSLAGDAGKVARAVRRHWGIENRVHWVLDVVFDEDDSRIRKDHGPQNFAVLRHIALNLLRQETSSKASIKAKQKKAGWDNAFLDKILTL